MALADFGYGVDQAIQQQIARRLFLQQQQFENQRQLAADQRANRQLDLEAQNQALQRQSQLANINSEIDARKSTAENQRVGRILTAREKTPAGTVLQNDSPTDMKTVQDFQSADLGGTLTPQATLASTQFSGPAGGFLRTSAQTPQVYGMRTLPTDAQQKEADAAAEKAASLKRETDRDTATQNYQSGMLSVAQKNAETNAAREQKSPEGGNNQLVPEIDPKTGQQTGRYFSFNSKTNSWGMPTGAGPEATKPNPGAAQAAQLDAGKKEALGSLDQLDQAIENARDLIGPGKGRVSSIEQMVGNADPRISALGTKMLLAKMQVDHAASGTVRAGASPQILQRWDNILGNNQTPEGLKAAVQAMREILGGGQISSTPTTARKRYNPATGQVE